MKNLFKILILTLLFNFLFSIGERVDEIKYNIKHISTFSNITGWSNIQGVWKSSKNKIPIWDLIDNEEEVFFRDGLGKDNIVSISIFTIDEIPDIIIMTFVNKNGSYEFPSISSGWFHYYNMNTFIFNRNDFKTGMKLIDGKLTSIELDCYSFERFDSYFSEPTIDETENYIKTNIDKYLNNYKKDSYSSRPGNVTFYLDYYIYKNSIQYMFTYKVPKMKKQYPMEGKGIKKIKKFLDKSYYESPLNEFEKFIFNN
tara:strand:- start:218 stop:985 length:768 start_codon:yes stop_codon:yes gene_type:complete